MAHSPGPTPLDSARAAADPHYELLQEATKDYSEIDQVCHGTPFAETEQIEHALSLLRKWSDGAEQRYGTEAMRHLRSKGIAVSGKTERRKVELSRVLNIRKKSADGDKGEPESPPTPASNPEPHQASTSAFTPVNKIVEAPRADQRIPDDVTMSEALPTPQSADRPRHDMRNGHGSPVGLHQGVSPSPRDSPSEVVARSAVATESQLFCHQCRIGPLACTHSHRLVGKIMERGLEHAAIEEKEIALKSILQMRDGVYPHRLEPAHNSSIAKSQLRADQDAWIAQIRADLRRDGSSSLSPRSHRKTQSLGSTLESAPRAERVNGNRLLSLPNTPDVATSLAHEQEHRNRANTDATSKHGPTINGNSTTIRNGLATDSGRGSAPRQTSHNHPPTKRRSRQERQWCKVCKSNPYWCMHRQDYADLLPRSARFSAGYFDGEYETPVMNSPEGEASSSEPAAKKRKKSGPQARRVPPHLSLRGDSYRDSGVGLSSNDDDATEEEAGDQEPNPYLSRGDPRTLSEKDRELGLFALFETMTREELLRSVVDICIENPLVESWHRANRERKRPRAQPESAGVVVNAEEKNLSGAAVATEDAEPLTERNSVPLAMAICRICDANFDANSHDSQTECRYHPGELKRKVESWGRESLVPIEEKDRVWVTADCPSFVIWTCCNAIGSSRGCQKGTHVAASPVAEQPTRVGDWVAARAFLPEAHAVPADTLTGRIQSRGSRVVSAPAFTPPAPVASPPQMNGIQAAPVLVQSTTTPASWASQKHQIPATVQEKPLRGHSNAQMADTDYKSLPDYCPTTNNLQGDPATVFTIESPYSNPLNLSNDPDQNRLHEAELIMASKLRMTCASYLCSKRRIFQGVVEKLSKGKEYRKIHAQQACKIDARKARWLFSAFHQVGWFEPEHFQNHLPEPTQPLQPKESSDSEALSSVAEQGGGPSPPRSHSPQFTAVNGMGASPATTAAPKEVATPAAIPTEERRTKTPAKRRWAESFAPATDTTPDGERVTREVLQWRKKGDGRKEMTPTCPYPPSWAEADSIDRAMVRMKRREKRAWPDIFEWWTSKGRTSLKNASCLAVRYSIMKRKFEPIWLREEMEEGEPIAAAAATGSRPSEGVTRSEAPPSREEAVSGEAPVPNRGPYPTERAEASAVVEAPPRSRTTVEPKEQEAAETPKKQSSNEPRSPWKQRASAGTPRSPWKRGAARKSAC